VRAAAFDDAGVEDVRGGGDVPQADAERLEQRDLVVRGADVGIPISSSGGPVNWNTWVRQIHRWMSIAFTVGFIINMVAVVLKVYAVWVGLLALLPLLLLLLTGLYLFVLPYAAKWRGGRRTGG
jgi:hypothetical protein